MRLAGWVGAWLACAAPWLCAQEAFVELTAAQAIRLGVQWSRPERAADVAVVTVSAEAVVPPSGERLVSAPIGGLVTRLFIAEGSSVAAGDPLVELQSPELLGLQREYLDAMSARRLADSQLARDEGLHDEGIVAQRRVDEANAAAGAARTRAEQARQQLVLVGMQDRQLAKLLEEGNITTQLTLTAPGDGIVVARHIDVGEQLHPLDPVARIADLSVLWLEARVPQERADTLSVGMRMNVVIRGEPAAAEIFQLGRVVDSATQTVMVRAEIDNSKLLLRGGQLLAVRIVGAGGVAGSLSVPLSAIVRTDGSTFVFVRREHGFDLEPITIVGEAGNQVFFEAARVGPDSDIAVDGVSALKSMLTADDESD